MSKLTQCNSPKCATGNARGRCKVCGAEIDTALAHYVLDHHMLCDTCAIAAAIVGEEKGT